MSKIKVTQQQRDNLLDAMHNMWPSVPEANVSPKLERWRMGPYPRNDAPHCGTVCCFGGWCAVWPSFVAQGVKADDGGEPVMRHADAFQYSVGERLFGDENMFFWRGKHPADWRCAGSDHALVTNRLQWLLDNSEIA